MKSTLGVISELWKKNAIIPQPSAEWVQKAVCLLPFLHYQTIKLHRAVGMYEAVMPDCGFRRTVYLKEGFVKSIRAEGLWELLAVGIRGPFALSQETSGLLTVSLLKGGASKALNFCIIYTPWFCLLQKIMSKKHLLSKKQQCVLSQIWLFTAPWTVARQAPLSIEVSRQKHWNRLPFPLPGDLPDPGIKPTSPVSPALAGGFFTTVPPEKPKKQ